MGNFYRILFVFPILWLFAAGWLLLSLSSSSLLLLFCCGIRFDETLTGWNGAREWIVICTILGKVPYFPSIQMNTMTSLSSFVTFFAIAIAVLIWINRIRLSIARVTNEWKINKLFRRRHRSGWWMNCGYENFNVFSRLEFRMRQANYHRLFRVICQLLQINTFFLRTNCLLSHACEWATNEKPFSFPSPMARGASKADANRTVSIENAINSSNEFICNFWLAPHGARYGDVCCSVFQTDEIYFIRFRIVYELKAIIYGLTWCGGRLGRQGRQTDRRTHHCLNWLRLHRTEWLYHFHEEDASRRTDKHPVSHNDAND